MVQGETKRTPRPRKRKAGAGVGYVWVRRQSTHTTPGPTAGLRHAERRGRLQFPTALDQPFYERLILLALRAVAYSRKSMTIALRFISGKYQGGEFPLEEGREVVIGRSTDLDMVLVDEMVSRRHAKLVLGAGKVELTDLDSTNGVFVNGERVRQASVGIGDRILVGSNILRLVQLESSGHSKPPTSSSSSEVPLVTRRSVRRPRGESGADIRMSGSLDEIPLPDLLQLFGSSRKDGVLWIDNGESVGRIVLKTGRIRHAQIDSPDGTTEPTGVAKSIYRMLTWDHGVFELDPPSSKNYPESAELTVQEVLMEGFRQKDELELLQNKIPTPSTKLVVPKPLQSKLSELETRELDTLQLAYNRGTVGGVTSESELTDLETAQVLLKLIKSGYLKTEDA